MSAQNDGGLAFPELDSSWIDRDGVTRYASDGGISVRDYFAVKADIPWEVAADLVYRQNGNANGTIPQILAKRAELRFGQADAMLAERAKGEQS